MGLVLPGKHHHYHTTVIQAWDMEVAVAVPQFPLLEGLVIQVLVIVVL
ncbi:hypothetical protein BF242_004036 [Escherichia coli]|nr:hypothetical protein [Escherichia coli]